MHLSCITVSAVSQISKSLKKPKARRISFFTTKNIQSFSIFTNHIGRFDLWMALVIFDLYLSLADGPFPMYKLPRCLSSAVRPKATNWLDAKHCKMKRTSRRRIVAWRLWRAYACVCLWVGVYRSRWGESVEWWLSRLSVCLWDWWEEEGYEGTSVPEEVNPWPPNPLSLYHLITSIHGPCHLQQPFITSFLHGYLHTSILFLKLHYRFYWLTNWK